MDILTTKKTYSKNLKKIFNLLSIEGKYMVIGSNALKSIKYGSDYDLAENYETKGDVVDKLYQLFKSKFEYSKKDKNIFITDFKCGMDADGEPLRWTYKEVMLNKKKLQDGREVQMQDCFLVKTTLKLDVVALVDGVFNEFSENYYLKINNDSNYFNHDIDKEHILNSIKHDFDKYYYVQHDYLKGLKRCFSYKSLENTVLYKNQLIALINFFNSDVGRLNKVKSELEVVLDVMDNEFRKPDTLDLIHNLQLCINKLHELYDSKLIDMVNLDKYKKSFETINNKTEDTIHNLIFELLEVINKLVLDFVSKNKSILLY